MYINFQLLQTKGLSTHNLMALIAIKQNKSEDLADMCEALVGLDLPFLEQQELVTYVKAKRKSDTKFNLIRLSSKGQKLLDDLETPEILEQDIIIFDWLAESYRANGKTVKNGKQCKRWIALFRVHSGIQKNALVTLANNFMADSDQQKWSQVLDYVFFKPESAFNVRFDLESSKLYKYYLDNKDYYDQIFSTEKYNN